MNSFKHSVLGTPYSVSLGSRKEISISEENMGECRVFSKELSVCTDKSGCTEQEFLVRTQEIVAHEVFHAYVNEAGLDIDNDLEELLATFYMKNWRKLHNSVLEILDKSGFLDN